MYSGAANAGRNAATFLSFGLSNVVNGGIALPYHHLVQVLFRCERCGRGFRKTYELRGTGQKQNRNGSVEGLPQHAQTFESLPKAIIPAHLD